MDQTKLLRNRLTARGFDVAQVLTWPAVVVNLTPTIRAYVAVDGNGYRGQIPHDNGTNVFMDVSFHRLVDILNRHR